MRLFILIGLTLLLTMNASARDIRVAAAANTTYVMKAITKVFEKKNPSLHVKLIIGSSGKLSAQIQHGAPYDIFLSADRGYVEKLFEAGFGEQEMKIYAKGALVLFSTKEQDFSQGLAVLAHKNIRRIALANPKTAPYGARAKEALVKRHLYTTIQAKCIYAESISQTLSYVIRAADIGIVAKSALFAPSMKAYKKGYNWIEIDTSLYAPIEQGMLLVKGASKEATLYYNFLQSEEAKQLFLSYGYTL